MNTRIKPSQPVVVNQALLGLLILLVVLPATNTILRAEIVYDNSQLDYDNMFFPSKGEYGDEIHLGGSARTVSEFSFQYYGEFKPKGNETVRVRFYANDDGPDGEQSNFASPGTLLYESAPLPLLPGFNILKLRGLSVPVHNKFTWTVKYDGISGEYQDRVGLSFFDPPAVGSSYSDFWMKLDTTWGIYNFNGAPIANFGARVIASPDSPLELVSIQYLPNQRRELQIQGSAYQSGVLESSPDLTHWTPLQSFTLMGQPIKVVDTPSTTNTMRFYRVKKLAAMLIQLSKGNRMPNKLFQFRLFGEPGRNYKVEASDELNFWYPLSTNSFVSLYSDFIDTESQYYIFGRFYRATYAADWPVYLTSMSLLTNGAAILELRGQQGRDCLIEASSDFKTWDRLATNTFSYTSGVINYIDPQLPSTKRRFYRASLLP